MTSSDLTQVIVVFDTSTLRAELGEASTFTRQLRELKELHKFQIAIPMVVMDEINRYLRNLDDRAITEFNDAIKLIAREYSKLCSRELILHENSKFDVLELKRLSAALCSEEKRIQRTKEKLEMAIGKNFITLDYPRPEHQALVKRLLDGRRPFKAQQTVNKSNKGAKPNQGFKSEGDDGYRDALIWFSICDLLQSRPEAKVVFISHNTKDFGNDSNLHPDFLQDLSTENRERITYYSKLDAVISHFKRLDSSGQKENEPAKVPSSLGIRDFDSVIDSDFAHNLLFETLLGWLDKIDEEESTESFFVRSTFNSFALLNAAVSNESIGTESAGWIIEATYIAKVSLFYHHSYGERLVDHQEQRGLRISTKLMVDTDPLKLTNLSVLRVDDEPVVDFFVRAMYVHSPSEGWSNLIVEPPNLAEIATERIFSEYEDFERTMLLLGASKDSLNRRDSTKSINVFYVSPTSQALLEKFKLVRTD